MPKLRAGMSVLIDKKAPLPSGAEAGGRARGLCLSSGRGPGTGEAHSGGPTVERMLARPRVAVAGKAEKRCRRERASRPTSWHSMAFQHAGGSCIRRCRMTTYFPGGMVCAGWHRTRREDVVDPTLPQSQGDRARRDRLPSWPPRW